MPRGVVGNPLWIAILEVSRRCEELERAGVLVFGFLTDQRWLLLCVQREKEKAEQRYPDTNVVYSFARVSVGIWPARCSCS